jgi:hypothetical protein
MYEGRVCVGRVVEAPSSLSILMDGLTLLFLALLRSSHRLLVSVIIFIVQQKYSLTVLFCAIFGVFEWYKSTIRILWLL